MQRTEILSLIRKFLKLIIFFHISNNLNYSKTKPILAKFGLK